MAQAAAAKAHEVLPQTTLLGVTFLTSLDPHDLEQMYRLSPEEIRPCFKNFFTMAAENNLGLILSPHELPLAVEVEAQTHLLLKVCPGIRFAEDGHHDQKRISTPVDALQAHADYLVIGRALTQVDEQRLTQRLAYLGQELSAVTNAP